MGWNEDEREGVREWMMAPSTSPPFPWQQTLGKWEGRNRRWEEVRGLVREGVGE